MAKDEWTEIPVESDEWEEVPVDDTLAATPRYGATQSAIQHGIHGATGGYSDELNGLGEALGRVVGVKGAGMPMKDMGLEAPAIKRNATGMGPAIDWETLRDAYKAARDHERSTLKTQSEEHPMVSGAADLAGSIASPINKLAKGMSLAKGGMALGGINALGNSDAEDLGGMALDTGLGIAGGGIAGKVLDKAKGIGPMLKGSVDDVANLKFGGAAPAPAQAPAAVKELGSEVFDPFTRTMVPRSGAPINAAPSAGRKFDPFTREAFESAAPEAVSPEASPGLIAKALQKANQLGAGGNQLLEKITSAMTPSTGSEQADALLKGAGKLGRYGVMGKIQGGLDALEHGPKAAKWVAQKASPALDKAGEAAAPYMNGLAERSPQVFQTIMDKLKNKPSAAVAKNETDKFEPKALISKTQGTKYQGVLQQAAQRGPQAVRAANFVLQGRDPEYRKLTIEDEDRMKQEEQETGS